MIILHTPGKCSGQLIKFSKRFERDRNFVGANRALREEVVSDGRDQGICVRAQSIYTKRVR